MWKRRFENPFSNGEGFLCFITFCLVVYMDEKVGELERI